MGKCCFARWRLSFVVVVCNAAGWGPAGCQARGRLGARHCTAGKYGYVPLGQHIVLFVFLKQIVNQSSSICKWQTAGM